MARAGTGDGSWVGCVNFVSQKLPAGPTPTSSVFDPTAVFVNGNHITPLPAEGFSSSTALAQDGQEIVGTAFHLGGGSLQIHPFLWSLKTGSGIDLLPAGFEQGNTSGVAGPYQVGTAWNGDLTRAILWKGDAGSAQDMTPAGCAYGAITGILQMDATHFALGGYAGEGVHNPHPLYWPGLAVQPVDLLPAGASMGDVFGLDADTQVGDCDLSPGLWHGKAESFVSLLPTGTRTGAALDVAGNFQVGYVTLSSSGTVTAALWRGTAKSFVDLSTFLARPGLGYTIARSINVKGGRIEVFGEAQRFDVQGKQPPRSVVHAVRWTYTP